MRILIVDDERLARQRVRRLLAEIVDTEIVAEAADGHEALRAIQDYRPDVVLLDINMPGIDGLEVAAQATVPVVIFTTAHVERAAEAFDADAVDYLLKPIRSEQLERALSRAERRLRQQTAPAEHRLTVHTKNGVRFVDARTVVAFRATDKYTEFEVAGEHFLLRESLDALEKQLQSVGFARVHRKALVRRDAVVGFEGGGGKLVLSLSDGSLIPVSRRRSPGLRKLLGLKT